MLQKKIYLKKLGKLFFIFIFDIDNIKNWIFRRKYKGWGTFYIYVKWKVHQKS